MLDSAVGMSALPVLFISHDSSSNLVSKFCKRAERVALAIERLLIVYDQPRRIAAPKGRL